MPARIGTEFAGYRVEAVVGRGGTSTVYRAEHLRLGISVALKILHPELAEDEAFRARFVRESRLAAAINHPNIIPIYDAGVWEEALFIAMRYVPGGDLRRRLRDGPMPPDRLLPIVAQAAGGLDAAHARDLVHRDVKPANIMIDAGFRETGPEVAYVTDFGLIKDASTGAGNTATGEFVGTIHYVAPEQIEERPVDGRTDVYSLGCVVFECLTGRPPFVRETEAAVLWAHMQEPVPPVTAARPELPAAVDAVVARALAKDPGDRFATCSSFLAALRGELEPDEAGASTVTLRLPPRGAAPARPSRRRRRVLPAALLALAAAASGTAAGFLLAGGSDTEAATVTTATTTTAVGEATGSRLLAAIPESLRGACGPAPPPTPDFDEALICHPERGADVVRYSHAWSGELLTAYFSRRASAIAGVRRPGFGTRVRSSGSCSGERLPALEEWRAFGRAGHDPGPSTIPDGRVLCHRDSELATIEWTNSRLGIYARASARNYATLFDWWAYAAGPLH